MFKSRSLIAFFTSSCDGVVIFTSGTNTKNGIIKITYQRAVNGPTILVPSLSPGSNPSAGLLPSSVKPFSCSTNKEGNNEVNLYSQRHYSVDELQYKNFTEKTGIKVNVVKANADELIERLKNEGENSPADLFVTVDAGKLYNARHSSTLPENYTLSVLAVSQSWQEGDGLDMVNYTDKTYGLSGSTWTQARNSGSISAVDDGKWTSAGGDYHSSPTFEANFTEGYEDLEVNVTSLVEQWLAGTKENYGFGVKFKDSFEQQRRSYYTKKFFARGTEFYYKRPCLEARWDNAKQDDRGTFFLSSSLAPKEDNTNTIYLYNSIRGRLRNIPAIGTDGQIYVSIFSGSSDDKSPSGSAQVLVNTDNAFVSSASPLVVTGGYVSTGVYSASFAYTGSSTLSTIYDVWWTGSARSNDAGTGPDVTQFTTGSIKVNSLSADVYNPSKRYILSLSNLRKDYGPSETARFKLYARPRDWSPTIHTKAVNVPETTIITSASYEIFRDSDGLRVIPFGTGSDYHTGLSYNISGNYFDLNMSNLEKGQMYGIRFAFYDDAVGSWNTQPYEFKFKVRNDEY